jgi:hypothetical protein
MSFWAAGLCGIIVSFTGSLATNVCHAQDLAPRAYIITPIRSNAITLTYSFFKPRLWVSLDANYWFGGTTSLNGVENLSTLQKNSRLGGTAAIPLSGHQSIKFSYSNGTYIRYGGNFQNISVAWQYSWLRKT